MSQYSQYGEELITIGDIGLIDIFFDIVETIVCESIDLALMISREDYLWIPSIGDILEYETLEPGYIEERYRPSCSDDISYLDLILEVEKFSEIESIYRKYSLATDE